MTDQKAASFYSTGGASVGAAIGGVLGSIVAPGVGTAAMAKMGAGMGAIVGYSLYKVAEINGYTGYTGVPHMLVDATIAGIKYFTTSQNQSTNQNTSAMQNTSANQNIPNSNSHAKMAELMPRVEQVVSEVVAFSQERSKKVEQAESQKLKLGESQKVEQDKSQEVEEERHSFGYH